MSDVQDLEKRIAILEKKLGLISEFLEKNLENFRQIPIIWAFYLQMQEKAKLESMKTYLDCDEEDEE